jgi:hypothetical protein
MTSRASVAADPEQRLNVEVSTGSGVEAQDAFMQRRTKILMAGGAVALIASAGAGIAVAGGGADNEAPITGDALDKASAAALDHTGEGRVTETEVGDEESYYEVEVTLDDGSQVDVQLDRSFNVVGSEGDEENEGSNDD